MVENNLVSRKKRGRIRTGNSNSKKVRKECVREREMGNGGMENCVKRSFFFHFFKRPFYISNHCQGPFSAIIPFILIFQFPVASNTALRIYRLKYVENLFPVGKGNIFFLSMCYFFSCRVTLKKGKKRMWKRKEIALAH